MAKIKNVELTEGHLKTLKRIVEGLRSRDLKELAALFSIQDSADAKQLIQKINDELDKNIELTTEQIDFFYKHAPNRKLFDFLPSKILREYASAIASEIGKDEFELLILLSNKTDELKDQINAIRPLDEDKRTQFKQEFSRILRQNVFEPLHIDVANAGSNVTRLRTENIELANQVTDLQQTINQMRETHSEEIDKKRDEISQLNNKINALNNEIEELKKQKSALLLQINDLQKELNSLREQFELRVREETEKRFAECLRAWFPQASQVESKASTISTDVVDFARETLKRQEERDRNVGNRRTLLTRLNELEKIRVELVDALENAINPMPDLKTAISKIDEEISRIRLTLGMTTEKDKLRETLMSLVNTITDFDEYDRLLKFSEFLKERQIIDEDLFRKMWDVVYSRYTIDVQLTPQSDSARNYSIRKKLKDNSECLVILDAHNIILHDLLKHRLFAPVQEQSRNNLLRLIKPLAAGRDNVKFTVVFDGSNPNEEKVAQNVRIIFSGGEGQHRADNKIVEIVRSNPGTDIFVVTDDEQLIKDVKSFGAQPIRIITFICILQEFGALKKTFSP